tara:strand:+ start:1301 stop:1684 length:384 start_codon:yes stop_codon:yes gene_type:complete
MNLLNNKSQDKLSKDKIEKIQKKKTEYKMLASFSRSKGLKLYSYNIISQKIEELCITYSNEAHMFYNGEELDWYDPAYNKVNVDSKNIHFEVLNMENAIRRVNNYRKGKINDLFNLKSKVNKRINFY